jgi:hypothetical protein
MATDIKKCCTCNAPEAFQEGGKVFCSYAHDMLTDGEFMPVGVNVRTVLGRKYLEVNPVENCGYDCDNHEYSADLAASWGVA